MDRMIPAGLDDKNGMVATMKCAELSFGIQRGKDCGIPNLGIEDKAYKWT